MNLVLRLRALLRRLIERAATRSRAQKRCVVEQQLLDTFIEKLDILRALDIFDFEALGADVANSFVVDVTTRLCESPKAYLHSVGTLHVDAQGVNFGSELDEHLRHQTLLLQEFCKKHTGSDKVSTGITWNDFFSDNREPFPGLDLIARVSTSLLRNLDIRNPDNNSKVRQCLETGVCLAIHDAVCCHAGIELETIGTFVVLDSQVAFQPDGLLISSIRAARGKRTESAKPNWLRVGPRPL